MSPQTKNSCAEAFGNRSRNKNLKPKKLRGGGGQIDPPPPYTFKGKVYIILYKTSVTNFVIRTNFKKIMSCA